jgi:hypothetical protein
VIEIVVAANSSSRIRNTEITIEGSGFRVTLGMNAGGRARSSVLPMPLAQRLPGSPPLRLPNTTDVQLTVATQTNRPTLRRAVTVYAYNISTDSEIDVLGIRTNEFTAEIRHKEFDPIAPACTLRCTPNSPPLIGPGCLDCDVGGIKFRVCC